MTNTLWACAGAGALILALTGCSSAADPAQASGTSKPTPTASATSSAPTSISAPKPVPPKAANGRKYAVCAKRTCEVAVSNPVEIQFGGSAPGALSVKKVTGKEMRMDLSLDGGGGGNGTIRPGCGTFVFQSYGGGSGTLSGPSQRCEHDMPKPEPGAVTVQVPKISAGVAILRIVTT